MSYEIIYDKQFIKLADNKYIPMFLSGSNNCYESNRKRSRSWSAFNYFTNGNYFGTLEEMLETIHNEREKVIERKKEDNDSNVPDIDKSWGYWVSIAIGGSTRRTTFGSYKGLIITGVKKALTVEELIQQGISVRINSYNYFDNVREGFIGYNLYPKTSEELEAMIFEKVAEKEAGGYPFTISLSASEYNMKCLRANVFGKREKREKQEVQVNEFWVLSNNGGYFIKNLKFGYRYCSYLNSRVKRFMTEKEANRFLSNANVITKEHKWNVERIESPYTFYVTKK